MSTNWSLFQVLYGKWVVKDAPHNIKHPNELMRHCQCRVSFLAVSRDSWQWDSNLDNSFIKYSICWYEFRDLYRTPFDRSTWSVSCWLHTWSHFVMSRVDLVNRYAFQLKDPRTKEEKGDLFYSTNVSNRHRRGQSTRSDRGTLISGHIFFALGHPLIYCPVQFYSILRSGHQMVSQFYRCLLLSLLLFVLD